MARAKSPRRSARSAAAAAPAFSIPDQDELIALAAQLGVTVGIMTLVGGSVPTSVNDFMAFFTDTSMGAGNGLHRFWPFSFMLTAHVLHNASNSSGGGWWVAQLFNVTLACFSNVALMGFLTGAGFGELLSNEHAASAVFVAWWLVNKNVPMTDFSIWDTVTDLPHVGAALTSTLAFASEMWVATCVVNAAQAGVAAAGAPGPLGFAFVLPCFYAAATACATDFFPLDKGLKIRRGAAIENAFLTALFISSNGFAAVPFAGQFLGPLVAKVVAVAGGSNASFCLVLTAFNSLFGGFVPPAVYDVKGQVLGFVSKATNIN